MELYENNFYDNSQYLNLKNSFQLILTSCHSKRTLSCNAVNGLMTKQVILFFLIGRNFAHKQIQHFL